MADRIGVLIMAHGTPSNLEGLEGFYTRIRKGRRPSAQELQELAARYRAIGGTSPLNAVTTAQVNGVERALSREQPGRFVVRYGAKHTEPFVEDAANALLESKPAAVIALVLTPHWSTRGSGEYFSRAAAVMNGRVPLRPIKDWYSNPAFISLQASRVLEALDRARRGDSDGTGSVATGALAPDPVVVFTAHSLPERAVRLEGDPYPDQVQASAGAVARAAGIRDWRVAWQSAGRTPEAWIGPDILDVLPELAANGTRNVVVCPIGFVADHLEVLYDIDIQARELANKAGLQLVRTASLNDDGRFIELLAELIKTAADDLGDWRGVTAS